MRHLIALVAICLVQALSAQSIHVAEPKRPSSPPSVIDQASRMDQVVQSYVTSKRFMGSVLVARGKEILLSKGYGSANLEWDLPNSPSTKFRLGSLTKQFTAASILLLEERGKLK